MNLAREAWRNKPARSQNRAGGFAIGRFGQSGGKCRVDWAVGTSRLCNRSAAGEKQSEGRVRTLGRDVLRKLRQASRGPSALAAVYVRALKFRVST